jgi:hypothetical protein
MQPLGGRSTYVQAARSTSADDFINGGAAWQDLVED